MNQRSQNEIEELERLADWLDSRFRIPGSNIRFGLDSVLGLVPVVGDGATTIAAGYLIWRARQLGASNFIIVRMIINALMDLGVGAIPLIGDLFDFAIKSNQRNIALLKRHLAEDGAHRRRDGHAAGRSYRQTAVTEGASDA